MLLKWAQSLRGKTSLWQNLLIDVRGTQQGLEKHIKGCRAEDEQQRVSKARYHMKVKQVQGTGDCVYGYLWK